MITPENMREAERLAHEIWCADRKAPKYENGMAVGNKFAIQEIAVRAFRESPSVDRGYQPPRHRPCC